MCDEGMRSLKAVNIFSVSDSHHQDKQGVVSNLINDPIVPHLDTIEILHALQLFEPRRARVVRQGINLRFQPFLRDSG